MPPNWSPESQHKPTLQATGGAWHRTETLTSCVDERNVVLNAATGICAIKRMREAGGCFIKGVG